MKKINIIFFSANRAEYSLIQPFLKIFSSNKKFNVSLIVAGSHLDKKFGSTLIEIEKDKVNILAKIKIPLKTNTLLDTVKYSYLIQKEVYEILKKNKIDIAFVSSDRFETFAFANSVYLNQIPLVHYEGGDITEGGALDDNIRHAITKLSSIHLTSNHQSYSRLLKMGEEKWRCVNVGYSPIYYLKKNNSLENIEKKFFLKNDKPVILFTLHPVIENKINYKKEIRESFLVLKNLYKKNYQIIITYPNFDPGYKYIIKKIISFKKNFKKIKVFKHLGRENYHSLLYYIGKKKNGLCIGNSSSGIKEAVIFKCPAINIGVRQKSRLKPSNVIDVRANHKFILDKVKKNLKTEGKKIVNPYSLTRNFKILPSLIIQKIKKKKFSVKKCTY